MRAVLVLVAVAAVVLQGALSVQAGAVSLSAHQANATRHNGSVPWPDRANSTPPVAARDVVAPTSTARGQEGDAAAVVPNNNHTRHTNDSAASHPPPLPPRRNAHADFSLCPNQCQGRAVDCVPQPRGLGRCVCLPGFADDDCGRWVGCSAHAFCNGHGQCACHVDRGCVCECTVGWSGADCASPASTMCPNHCSGRGRCQETDHTCDCDAGYTGEDCSRVVLPSVCVDACSAQGSCDMDKGDCHCTAATEGEGCSSVVDSCGGCRHGRCGVVGGVAACVCSEGFAGAHCDEFVPEADQCAPLGFCSGHGVCVEGACSCQDAFEGLDCSVVSTGGLNNCTAFCSGNGQCDTVTNACVCDAGFTGPDCSQHLCPSTDGVVCNGRGVCGEQAPGSGFECLCDPCFSGPGCADNAIEECPSLCNNHGQCECQQVHRGNRTYAGVCKCDEGWEGDECQLQTDAPQCCPLDCSGNGNCKDCLCECFDDWVGEDCASRATAPAQSPEEAALDDLTTLVQTAEGASPGTAAVRSMRALWD